MRIPLLALGLSLSLPAAASACSCYAPGNGPRPEMVVFAQAIRTTYNPAASEWEGIPISNVEVELRVFRSWRHRSPTVLRLSTGVSSADCGYDFDAGHEYIIPLFRMENGSWATGLCSGILEGWEATREKRRLGTGMRPLPSLEQLGRRDPRRGLVSILIGLGAVASLIGVLGFADARHLGRRTGST